MKNKFYFGAVVFFVVFVFVLFFSGAVRAAVVVVSPGVVTAANVGTVDANAVGSYVQRVTDVELNARRITEVVGIVGQHA